MIIDCRPSQGSPRAAGMQLRSTAGAQWRPAARMATDSQESETRPAPVAVASCCQRPPPRGRHLLLPVRWRAAPLLLLVRLRLWPGPCQGPTCAPSRLPASAHTPCLACRRPSCCHDTAAAASVRFPAWYAAAAPVVKGEHAGGGWRLGCVEWSRPQAGTQPCARSHCLPLHPSTHPHNVLERGPLGGVPRPARRHQVHIVPVAGQHPARQLVRPGYRQPTAAAMRRHMRLHVRDDLEGCGTNRGGEARRG